jgi:hypothetical protein
MMHFHSFIHINQFYQSIPRGISQTIQYIAFFSNSALDRKEITRPEVFLTHFVVLNT